MRSFAECLIARESQSEWPALNYALTENQATLGIVEKLRPRIEALMGKIGFHALLLNALAHAKDEVPWLGEAQINPDGSFGGFTQTTAQSFLGQSSSGGAAMLGWFFELLSSFIGELLTMELVLEVWPVLSRISDFPEAEEPWEDATEAIPQKHFAQSYAN